jgi:hypothetical protein
MATQQDIHAAGAENRPPMLEKGDISHGQAACFVTSKQSLMVN